MSETNRFDMGTASAPRGSIIRSSAAVTIRDIGAMHVIGRPGEGKSTFLGRFAEACIDEGEGVLLLDPKGDLALDLVQHTNHPDKLVYVAPGAVPGQTFCLNVMEVDRNHDYASRLINIVAENVVHLFQHLGRYDPTVMTLVTKYLDAASQLVYALPQPTLRDVALVFIDKGFRDSLRSASRRPDLQWFWEYFDDWSQRDQRVQVDSTLGRLWDFLTTEDVSFFVGNPISTLPIGDWLNAGKLVVVNLAQGLSYATGVRIGNLITAHLTNLYAMRESYLSDWDRTRRWRIVIDEFHELSPSPIARIIRQGRYFNIFPVVAHQDMGQLKRLDKDSDIPSALGLASRLEFMRSDADAPDTSAAYERFHERQSSLALYEADWTFRGLAGTTTNRIKMPNWNTTAKPEQLVAGMEQATQYTLPKSEIPSLRERYTAWQQGGKMDSNGTPKPTSKTKKARQNQVPRSGEVVPDGPDPARSGHPADVGPTGLLDLAKRRQDLLLGRDDGSEPEAPTPSPEPEPGS